jgi:pimeloyl-ACP methyl ester carboxylesterase
MQLLLLHGMGGAGALWDGVAAVSGTDAVRPDLAGHGTAPRLARYGFDTMADELAERVRPQLGGEPVRVIGHSLGGALAVVLAGRHPGLDVRGIVALGVKSLWSEDEIAAMHRVADKGASWFDDEAAARERFARVNGLAGRDFGRTGIVEDGGRWRLAHDPEALRVGVPDFAAMLAGVSCPVVLARGEHDTMAPAEQLERFGLPVHTVAGAGHNAHVEDPAAVLALLDLLPE